MEKELINSMHYKSVEQSVIGAIEVDNSILTDVKKYVKPEMFEYEPHRKIYKAILSLSDKALNIDMISVNQECKNLGLKVEMPDIVDALAYATPMNAVHYSKAVAERWMKKRLIRVSQEVLAKAGRDDTDVFDLITECLTLVNEIGEGSITQDNMKSFDKVLNEVEDYLDSLSEGFDSGIPSGITELDDLTGGWQNGRLYVIAARPAMGKSAMVTTCQKNAAHQGWPSAIFSLEMSKLEVAFRLISDDIKIAYSDMSKGRLSNGQKSYIKESLTGLRDLPIHIDDTGAIGLDELKSKARKLHREGRMNMLIVDYLQLMTEGSDNREREISKISGGLKALAKELNIPVIALSQLSRAVEQRENKRPMLSDLRESGAIEQDADMVIFLFRPEYYFDELGEECPEEYKGMGEVIVAKSRYTGLGNIVVKFDGAYSTFRDRPNLYQDMSKPQINR